MLPSINKLPIKRKTITAFGGLNLTDGCRGNEFCEMSNLSAEGVPFLSVRRPRAVWYGETERDDGSKVLSEGITETNLNGITAAECIGGKLVLCTDRSVYYDGEVLPDVRLSGGRVHRIVPFGRGFMVIPDNILVTVTDDGVSTQTVNAPVMDFAVNRNNRIYGCRYGTNSAGDTVNEIYVSKQGDATAWFTFDGISTDSYTVSVGTPGAFTGISVCGDNVLFFKESAIIVMGGDCPQEYTLNAIPCEGAEAGSDLSIVNIGNSVFYKSRAGITVFDGAWPHIISGALGIQPFTEAVAGAINNRYYVAMTLDGERAVYVYDIATALWHKEKCSNTRFFVRRFNCLLMINNPSTFAFNGMGRRYWSFAVTDGRFAPDGISIFTGDEDTDYRFGEEKPISWYAVTGRLSASSYLCGTLREVVFEITPDDLSEFTVGAYLDGERELCPLKTVSSPHGGLISVRCFLPVSSSVKLRLSGTGSCTVSAMTLLFEKATDKI